MALRVWLIDDSESQHAIAQSTVTRCPQVELTGFTSGAEAIAAYQQALLLSDGLPDLVLMDFQLGDERGDHVTRRWRAVEPAGHRAQIIGYSSSAEGSSAIVAAGGDAVVRKHGDASGVNPSLLRFLTRRVNR